MLYAAAVRCSDLILIMASVSRRRQSHNFHREGMKRGSVDLAQK
jgi:hypothetical protein